ncbi:Hypothetical protein A7982_01461 [Minicystis rosea]|nr:Hypothetical protein A7982_01461 [Minicystis rosea]
MNFRRTLAVAALGALGCIYATVGCGGDDCTRANDHYAECIASAEASSSSSGMPMTQACTGVLACQSQCINQHTCTQIQGNDPSYTDCLAKCQGK